MRIKLSVVVADLFGASGVRILHALAQDETDPSSLALLGDERLKCSKEQLIEALTGESHPIHRQMVAQRLDRLRQINEQIETVNTLIAQAMKPHQDAVIRLAQVPRFGHRPCTAGHIGSWTDRDHIFVSRRVRVLGRDLSWKRRKC
jgi:hypothetical protein